MEGSRARKNDGEDDGGGGGGGGGSFFLGWLKAVLLCACACGLAAGCFYWHPIVAPAMAELWSSTRSWCTAPVLFVLVNVVVGALYASSGMVHRGRKIGKAGNARKEKEKAEEKEEEEGEGEGEMPELSLGRAGEGVGANSKRRLRLPRSKSEQMFPAKDGGVQLRKSGTCGDEIGMARTTTPRHRLVVVADPAEEDANAPAPPGSEGVDQKAEDFIGRFYHKVKLQRLDSLLRRRQQHPTTT